MCVIAIKPVGIGFVSEYEKMQKANSDGIGICYVDGDHIHIEKGMLYAEFIERIDQLSDREVMVHFRLASSGSNIPELCHPFPYSAEYSDLTALVYDTDFAIAHNGHISELCDLNDPLWSDTMKLIKLLKRNNVDLFDQEFIEFILDQSGYGNRLAVMSIDGLALYGEWSVHTTKTKHQLMVSNDMWISHKWLVGAGKKTPRQRKLQCPVCGEELDSLAGNAFESDILFCLGCSCEYELYQGDLILLNECNACGGDMIAHNNYIGCIECHSIMTVTELRMI